MIRWAKTAILKYKGIFGADNILLCLPCNCRAGNNFPCLPSKCTTRKNFPCLPCNCKGNNRTCLFILSNSTLFLGH